MKTFLCILVSAGAFAQPPVAPTPQPAGSQEGVVSGNYNVTNSSEIGYRLHTVGGNDAQYRSAVNYGSGLRLLGSSLAVQSRDGHGLAFDQLRLATQGLGNDPYQSVRMLVEKNQLYRYDLLWRQNDYVNPGLVTAGGRGRHSLNTTYRMQDHSLTLFPQSRIRFFLGASLSSRTGAGYSSVMPTTRPLGFYPLAADVRRVWREYRVGNEFRVLGIRVNWMRGWENFKDDTTQALAPDGVPGFPPQPLPDYYTSFQSAAPTHGNSPYWRVNLFRNSRRLSVNGQFSYTAGRRAFVVDESASGAQPGGPLQNVITRGVGRRPVAAGNLAVHVTPVSRLTVTNTTSVYNLRTLGDSTFTQLDEPGGLFTILFYNYLGIRTVANDTTAAYALRDWIGFFGAYHYSDRLIRSSEQFRSGVVGNAIPSQQANTLRAGDFGIRLRPWRPFTVILSGEVGTNSRPFTPRADRNYHALNARVQYRQGPLQLSAAANTRYNTNSISLASYASQSRVYSFDGSWTPNAALSLDAGFTRNRTYTAGGIFYFADGSGQAGQRSLYFSNIHTVFVGLRGIVAGRVDWNILYSHMQDLGDGRSLPLGAGEGTPNPVFQAVQTFPVAFRSPSGRVSIRLRDKLRWNAGYQYYGYSQKFSADLDFRAHTGYTSVSLSF